MHILLNGSRKENNLIQNLERAHVAVVRPETGALGADAEQAGDLVVDMPVIDADDAEPQRWPTAHDSPFIRRWRARGLALRAGPGLSCGQEDELVKRFSNSSIDFCD